MTDDNKNKPAETTTAAATAKEQVEADNQELNAMISEMIHEMNSRPGSDPYETGNTVHRLIKSARDIQGEHDGFLTRSESFRKAIDRHNEFLITEAARADGSIKK